MSTPRLSSMLDHFCEPGTLTIVGWPWALISFCSMISFSASRPVTSRNWPAASFPPTVRRKWLVGRGFCADAIPQIPFLLSAFDLAGASGVLAEAEHHELGRLHRRDADLADDLAGLDHVGRVGLRVALDEERLLRGGPEERAVTPRAHEEVRRRDPQLHPQPLVVGLEHRPLRALHDRLGDVVEEPPDVDVAPLGVAGERAGAPDADAAARERADAVDADLVQAALLRVRDLEAEPVDAERDLVRGRLVDAAGGVGAAPDAGHVTRRRNQQRLVRQRVHDLDPGVVERGELGVVARRVHTPLQDLL